MVATPKGSGGIDTDSIKASALKDVSAVIDSVRGKKALILDRSLTGPLGLVVGFPVLREHGIDKVYHLEPGPLTSTHDKVIYLCRPNQRNAEMILGIISVISRC
jgi:vacuolar protein sorting-associated protein 33A